MIGRRELLLTLVAGTRALADRSPQGIQWPGFRGQGAAGVGDGFAIPASWNAAPTGKQSNVRWNIPIDGLGHASPVIWDEHIFVATAVPVTGEAKVRLGLYGDRNAASDGEQIWKIASFDKKTGQRVWERVAHQGTPRATRHIKATNANTTPATDGKILVCFFGSEGLYCYDLAGQLLWKKDLGVIDISKYGIGWGYASSPALYRDRILLQCDAPDDPFLVALSAKDGRELWRASRKGLCERSWGTPFIFDNGERPQVVTNGYPFIVSYDFSGGEELWRLRNGGDNPIPTPFSSGGLIYVASSHGGKGPIYAIRPDARGDISLADGVSTNKSVVWSDEKNSAYIQTPVAYRGLIYSSTNNGILKCYEAASGKRLYEERLGDGSTAFSASPVAGDGKVYITSEEGDVHVIAAGPKYRELAHNQMGDQCMATPAVSEGVLYFRTLHRLISVG